MKYKKFYKLQFHTTNETIIMAYVIICYLEEIYLIHFS